MANKDEILEVGLDHIHYYESRRGQNKGIDKDRNGSEVTRGEYHIQLDRAKLLDPDTYRNMQQSDYTAMIDSAEGPKEEKRLAKLYLENMMEESGVDFSGLTVGESVAFLSMNYNSGLDANPTTQKAFRLLANARNKNDSELGLYMEAAKGLIDLTRAFGEQSNGVMNRTKSHKETFDGNLNVESTMIDSGQGSTTAENRQETYQKIVDESNRAKLFVTQEMFLLQNEPVMAGFRNKSSEIGLGTFTSPEGTTRDVTIKEDKKLKEMQQGAR